LLFIVSGLVGSLTGEQERQGLQRNYQQNGWKKKTEECQEWRKKEKLQKAQE
jgi:hypothetical protein